MELNISRLLSAYRTLRLCEGSMSTRRDAISARYNRRRAVVSGRHCRPERSARTKLCASRRLVFRCCGARIARDTSRRKVRYSHASLCGWPRGLSASAADSVFWSSHRSPPIQTSERHAGRDKMAAQCATAGSKVGRHVESHRRGPVRHFPSHLQWSVHFSRFSALRCPQVLMPAGGT